ncbi:MAG: hypothetical protein IPO87_10545 [Flavobacteriales bacterium]|nr:hypothetical protein [Flavobacteriales bacterium]
MKHTLTLSLFFSFAFFSNAQNIQLLYNNEVVTNGSLLTYSRPTDSTAMEVDVEVLWATEGEADVNVRRYEVDVQAGTGNYFCWGVAMQPKMREPALFGTH